MRTYKYVFKLHCVEKWRIFNKSSIFTYLYKFGQPKKTEKNLVEYILDMWLIGDKIKDYPYVSH